MRRTFAILAGLTCLTCLVACSEEKVPVGRWEGAYEASDVFVAARLETASDGTVRVSAPDAVGVVAENENQRAAVRSRLAEGLANGWDSIAPRKMDFDGEVFRKPGGVAPQLEWNSKTEKMVMVVYLGTHPSIRVPLRAVKSYSDNPFEPQ
ncbi:MAG: hypothetical protein GC166_11740 [Alphaproteobacteria bacterium]|nr:hypothetical protein [Alphaproteobacteria bacterium]